MKKIKEIAGISFYIPGETDMIMTTAAASKISYYLFSSLKNTYDPSASEAEYSKRMSGSAYNLSPGEILSLLESIINRAVMSSPAGTDLYDGLGLICLLREKFNNITRCENDTGKEGAV